MTKTTLFATQNGYNIENPDTTHVQRLHRTFSEDVLFEWIKLLIWSTHYGTQLKDQ